MGEGGIVSAAYPKSRRLRKRREFLRVQETSTRITTRHFTLLLAPSPRFEEGSPCLARSRPRQGACRLGIVASKKVGCAVARNRVKRLLREAFRAHPSLFPDGVDLVIVAKPAPDLALADVVSELSAIGSLLRRRAIEVLRK